ncbi:hypothetical protein [Paenirhodobacter sp. CAU 1674]|uniref:hypothetical protein n=1 Tax=Paenirhodobacter sp. CAU 1674 TaxID=3032596 RepID=UPI0023DB995E|nr:hypothetical protein [Paenirhodobacter sp. CAU 1674]MDF2143333.1 hypothetical protein [Paenirhodobacter sp. CAU 1674]
MDKTQRVTVPVSNGDWSFSFELTLEQACEILNSRAGDIVQLNETREQIYVQDGNTLLHTKAANSLSHNDGSTSEGLQREATFSILNRMISEGAWESDDEAPC